MNKLFDNKNYPSVMFLLIAIMLVLLLFNFVNIVDNSGEKIEKEKRIDITSLAVFDNIEKNSMKSSVMFYLILSGLGINCDYCNKYYFNDKKKLT